MADLNRSPLDRRTLLRGAGGGVVAASWLVACGGDDDEPSESSGDGGDSESASTVSTSEVDVGGGAIVDEKYVVTQPTEGEFKAFTAICTHQGCVVASVADNTIHCDCHGSEYDAATGEVTNGPATKARAEEPISVEGNEITVG